MATPTPSPSPSPTPLPVISSVRVATGSAQSLHALPVAASVLDRAAIAASGAATADALLRSLPGFDRGRSNSMFTNYGQLRVSFAGAGNDRGLVLADGIPAQDGFGGQIDWAAYPTSDLQRVELLLGAGSALYGAGAVGGVLDLETLSPPTEALPFSGALRLGAGNNAFGEQSLSARGAIAQRLTASAILHQQRLQYFALPPGYQSSVDRISQSSQNMGAVRLRYSPGPRDAIEIEERGAWDDQFQGRPNYTFSRRLQQSSARYTHTSPQGSLQAALYTRSAFVLNAADQYPAKPGVPRYVQNVPTSESGASLHWTAGGDTNQFAILADARHVTGATSQYAGSGALQSAAAGIQNALGFAAQETWRSARFEALAGARLDSVGPDSALSPRLAFRFDLSPNITLRLSGGGALRAPYLNELLRGFAIGSVFYDPNPSLVPERSRTYSAGIDVLAARSHLSFDAFDTGVSDAIMFRTIDATHQMRSNVARTRTQAYVLNYTLALSPCSRVSAWYSSQNARVEAGPAAIAGKRLQYVPQNAGALDYAGAIGALGAGLTVSYEGQTYADDLNSQPLGTAVLVGARVQLPTASGATIDVRGDNLTGARYLSSVDRYGPPAVLTVTVTLPFGPKAPQAPACGAASSL